MIFFLMQLLRKVGFPCGAAGKESTCNAQDLGSIPGSGRSPGGKSGKVMKRKGENYFHDLIASYYYSLSCFLSLNTLAMV